jgi:hypothetical protein
MASQTDIIVAAGAPAPSALNWGAIIAGAIVATVSTLILMLVGSGLGLTMISPWSSQSASATTVLVSAAVWLVVVQWISACLGGYIAGRLRRRWTAVHSDEVVFRDSAHGLLAWSLATLLVVGFLGSAISGVVSSGVQAGSNVAAGATQSVGAGAAAVGSSSNPATSYFVDALFRPTDASKLGSPGPEGDAAAIGQATRVLVQSAADGQISHNDKDYLATLISARTGLSQADAQKRVNDVWEMIQNAKTKTQEAADTARKSAATTALLGALALLLGAFIASVSAILGGKLRDEDEDHWALANP